MKKLAMLLSLALICSTHAFAECRDGLEFPGAISNTTFCLSNISMNWWSAFAWCQAQGHRLATWEEACHGSTALTIGDYHCSNVGTQSTQRRIDGNAWLNRAWNVDKALYLYGSSCGVPCSKKAGTAARTTLYPALCIEN